VLRTGHILAIFVIGISIISILSISAEESSIPEIDSQDELIISSFITQQFEEKTRNALAQPQKEYVPGQLIVTFKQESDIPNFIGVTTFEDRLANAIPEHEKMVKWQSTQTHIAVIKIDPAEEQQFMQMLMQNPNVKSVERDFLVYPRGHVTSSDPLVSFQAWHYNAINLVGAWHKTTGSPSIILNLHLRFLVMVLGKN